MGRFSIRSFNPITITRAVVAVSKPIAKAALNPKTALNPTAMRKVTLAAVKPKAAAIAPGLYGKTAEKAVNITKDVIKGNSPLAIAKILTGKGPLKRKMATIGGLAVNPTSATKEKVMVGKYNVAGTRSIKKTVAGAVSGFATGGIYGAIVGAVAANFQKGKANTAQNLAVGAAAGYAASYVAAGGAGAGAGAGGAGAGAGAGGAGAGAAAGGAGAGAAAGGAGSSTLWGTVLSTGVKLLSAKKQNGGGDSGAGGVVYESGAPEMVYESGAPEMVEDVGAAEQGRQGGFFINLLRLILA